MVAELSERDKRAVEIAVQAGKMSVMVVYDEIAKALDIQRHEAKDLLDDLVQRGVLYESGEGSRNVPADPDGISKPVAWYTRW